MTGIFVLKWGDLKSKNSVSYVAVSVLSPFRVIQDAAGDAMAVDVISDE
ncbi:MAG: hypothetical protein ACJAVW_002953 [Spirosomataceae bacterium]